MNPIGHDATVADVVDWVFRLLGARTMMAADLMDLQRVRVAFDLGLRDNLEARSPVSREMLGPVRRRLQFWMAGKTFWDIELDFDVGARRTERCKNARKFVTNALADFAFVAGGVAQIRRYEVESDSSAEELPAALVAASGCIREGLDSAEKLHLRRRLPTFASRRSIHRIFAELAPLLTPRPAGETFADCGLRVDLAYDAWRSDVTNRER